MPTGCFVILFLLAIGAILVVLSTITFGILWLIGAEAIAPLSPFVVLFIGGCILLISEKLDGY